MPLFAAPGWGLPAFAVVYGLDRVATVPPTLALTVAAFGRLAGAVRDALGDCLMAFTAGALLAIGAGVACLAIARSTPVPAPAAAPA